MRVILCLILCPADKCKAVITFASKETEEVAQNVLRLDDSAFRGVHKVVDSSADESPG
jgi:hypothetical protein